MGTGVNKPTNAGGIALDGTESGQPGSNFVTVFNGRSLAAYPTPPSILYVNGQALPTYQGRFQPDYRAMVAASKHAPAASAVSSSHVHIQGSKPSPKALFSLRPREVVKAVVSHAKKFIARHES